MHYKKWLYYASGCCKNSDKTDTNDGKSSCDELQARGARLFMVWIKLYYDLDLMGNYSDGLFQDTPRRRARSVSQWFVF